jgi:hypothetical protein
MNKRKSKKQSKQMPTEAFKIIAEKPVGGDGVYGTR